MVNEESEPATPDNPGPPGPTLQQWFDDRAHPRDPALQAAFDLIPDRQQLRLEPFRRWLPLTSRYLFHRAD